MKMVPFNKAALAAVGITLIKDGARWLLRCDRCEQTWEIPSLTIPRDYWHCPWNCNIPYEEAINEH